MGCIVRECVPHRGDGTDLSLFVCSSKTCASIRRTVCATGSGGWGGEGRVGGGEVPESV